MFETMSQAEMEKFFKNKTQHEQVLWANGRCLDIEIKDLQSKLKVIEEEWRKIQAERRNQWKHDRICASRRFYHLYDVAGKHQKVPIITVCLMKLDDKICRGISICHSPDTPVKKVGINHANSMAERAMFAKDNIFSMLSDDQLGYIVREIMRRDDCELLYSVFGDNNCLYSYASGIYETQLTKSEKEMNLEL